MAEQKIRFLSSLNHEWSYDMKEDFLKRILDPQNLSKLGMLVLIEMRKIDDEYMFSPTQMFDIVLNILEDNFDDLLVRMFLCYQYPSNFGADDKDKESINELNHIFEQVLESNWDDIAKLPSFNFIGRNDKKTVTSLLVAMFLHKYKWDEEYGISSDLFDDMPIPLFLISYRTLWKNAIKTYVKNDVIHKNQLSKANILIDKQKEDISKLKKANSEIAKKVEKEYEAKLRKVNNETNKLKNTIKTLEGEKLKLQKQISALAEERSDYKMKWDREVEKNIEYEILKDKLLKEKEEIEKIKQVNEELKSKKHQYTKNEWVNGIFSIFMNQKEEIFEKYQESLMILNKELNLHFNEGQSSSTTSLPIKNERLSIKKDSVRKTRKTINYLKLIDNEWYIDDIKVTNDNPRLILIENMFVIVDENKKIISPLNAVATQGQTDGTYINAKNTFYCYYKEGKILDADGVEIKVTYKNSNTIIKDYQVVLINDKYEVLAVYPKMQLSVERIIPYVQMNHLELVVVKNIIDRFIIAKDILNEKDRMLQFDNLDDFQGRLEEDTTIIFKDRMIHTIFQSPLFYKMSDCYKDKEMAIVADIVDNDYFVEKMNGEIVKIQKNYSNYQIHVGDVVLVDRNNNFLYKENAVKIENDENKPLEFRKKIKAYKEKVTVPIKDSVLIIGNPSYKYSYELGMRKNGIKAEVVDGYSSYYLIKKKANYYDKIVVIPSFVSHDNMFKIKDEFTNKSVYYPEKDGVNYIYQAISK